MNKIALASARQGERSYLDIEVDGKPLAHHFVGRLGAHPSQISALGWDTAAAGVNAEVVAELLGSKRPTLASGRVPVLVCENCGDVGCGALCVRIDRLAEYIRWTDWSYENGYEAPRPVAWPTMPGEMLFDRHDYEAVLRSAVSKVDGGV